MRAAVGLGDAEVGEQQRHRLGGHGGASIGVDAQLVPSHPLLGDGVAQQALGQVGPLRSGQHPAGHVAAVDVDDHVEVVIGPLLGPEQLGDVPAEHLVGLGGHQLGLLGGRMGGLATALPHLAVGPQDAVHRRDRAQVDALVEESLAYTVAGASSTCSSLLSTASTSLRSTSPRARGWRAGTRSRRGGGGLLRCQR